MGKNKKDIPLTLQNNEYGKQKYLQFFDEMNEKLSIAEFDTFVTYCIEWGNYVQLELDIQKEGRTSVAGNGTTIPNPKFSMKQSTLYSLTSAAKQLGMTPQTRIKTGTKAKISKLDLLKSSSKLG